MRDELGDHVLPNGCKSILSLALSMFPVFRCRRSGLTRWLTVELGLLNVDLLNVEESGKMQ